MMIKKNVVSSQVTPCVYPGCHNTANLLCDGRAVCTAHASNFEVKTAADVGSTEDLIKRHAQKD